MSGTNEWGVYVYACKTCNHAYVGEAGVLHASKPGCIKDAQAEITKGTER